MEVAKPRRRSELADADGVFAQAWQMPAKQRYTKMNGGLDV
jgi:hypothetical protein